MRYQGIVAQKDLTDHEGGGWKDEGGRMKDEKNPSLQTLASIVFILPPSSFGIFHWRPGAGGGRLEEGTRNRGGAAVAGGIAR
jgi:predicted cupin superfamily sugar epimerase